MNDKIRDLGCASEAIHKHGAPLPKQEPGKHLWVVTGLWRVTPKPRMEFILDTENLISIDGPGCFWCEQIWSPAIGSQPCRGFPR